MFYSRYTDMLVVQLSPDEYKDLCTKLAFHATKMPVVAFDVSHNNGILSFTPADKAGGPTIQRAGDDHTSRYAPRGWYFLRVAIGQTVEGPALGELPRCGKTQVDYDINPNGFSILLPETPTPVQARQKRDHVIDKKAREITVGGKAVPARVVTHEDRQQFKTDMAEFKKAVTIVNRLRPKLNAELSLHHGALRADIRTVQIIKII